MIQGTKIEWIVTLGVFVASVTLLLLFGVEDSGLAGAIAFFNSVVGYMTVNWLGKKERKLQKK